VSEIASHNTNLYDKRRREIMIGDILKVYHFTDRHRKRRYMYKQCLGFKSIGPKCDTPYVMISHLNFIEDSTKVDGPYLLKPDGSILEDYEIVQGLGEVPLEDRPRKAVLHADERREAMGDKS